MSNQASGFICPKCERTGPHDIIWLDAGFAIRLVCISCETLWTEMLIRHDSFTCECPYCVGINEEIGGEG